MRDRRIVIYEPVRKADPEGDRYFGLLWFAVIVLLLVSWGLSWMWREAEAVIHHPFDAPLYTLFVLALFAVAHGLFIWGAFEILRLAISIGQVLILALVDLVTGLVRRIRNLFKRGM